MAAGIIQHPGTKFGPCGLAPNGEYLCDHTDCHATYGMANHRCSHCGERIGYGVGFFKSVDGEGLDHELCVYEDIEARREDIEARR